MTFQTLFGGDCRHCGARNPGIGNPGAVGLVLLAMGLFVIFSPPLMYGLVGWLILGSSIKTCQDEEMQMAEVSRKSINAIENGIYIPSTVLALKIAKTLGCKVEDLFKLP